LEKQISPMMSHDFLELFSRIFPRFVWTAETVHIFVGVRNAREDAEFSESNGMALTIRQLHICLQFQQQHDPGREVCGNLFTVPYILLWAWMLK
jgi:hypothetical protein